MHAVFKFVGSFRSISRTSKLSISLENKITIGDAIHAMAGRNPRLKNALIDPELNTPANGTIILVNGKEISTLNGLETKLKDGDEVVFVPVAHGG